MHFNLSQNPAAILQRYEVCWTQTAATQAVKAEQLPAPPIPRELPNTRHMTPQPRPGARYGERTALVRAYLQTHEATRVKDMAQAIGISTTSAQTVVDKLYSQGEVNKVSYGVYEWA